MHPLELFKYCPKCGSSHFVVNNEKSKRCADCAAKTEQYIKLDKRFKTALYLLVFLGGIGFVISAFFGGDSPLRMIGAYAGQLIAGLAFIAFPYPVTSFESFHAMSIRGVTRLTRMIGLVLSVSAVVLMVLTLR